MNIDPVLEKFEDIFKPPSDEEAKERETQWAVRQMFSRLFKAYEKDVEVAQKYGVVAGALKQLIANEESKRPAIFELPQVQAFVDDLLKKIAGLKEPPGVKVPLLTDRYIDVPFVESITEVPSRAKAFNAVLGELEKRGVQWKMFHRVVDLDQDRWKVNAGYQVMGIYKDAYIVGIATKVGVGSASSGYLVFVGREHEWEKAKQLGRTAVSSGAALKSILTKLDKVDKKIKNETIDEMAFEPGKTDKFIHPSRKKWIEQGDEELSQLFPDLTDNEQTYLEYVTSAAYQKMVERLEHYLEDTADDLDVPTVLGYFVKALNVIQYAEAKHTETLEKMALQAVLSLDEFEMVKEAYESNQVLFDIALGQAELDMPELEPEDDDLSDAEKVNLALASKFKEAADEARLKRRFANILIQGGAMLKMYLFKIVSKELQELDQRLPVLYGILATAAQVGYWNFPKNHSISQQEAQGSAGGSEEALPTENIYTIKVRAACFPYLVYELAKGIYEWISINEEQKQALAQDTFDDEVDDTIVGPEVFSSIQKMVQSQKLLPLVQKKIIASSRSTIKEILSGSERGKQLIKAIEQEAAEEWAEYKRQKEEDEVEEEYDDEDGDDVEESKKVVEKFEDIFKPPSDEEAKEREKRWFERKFDKSLLIDNGDGTYDYNGDLDFYDMGLTSLLDLPYKLRRVRGNFYCYNNKLTTLEGAPEKVGGNFYCYNNQLTTLEGAPEYVGGHFYYRSNPVSVKELKKTVDRDYLK